MPAVKARGLKDFENWLRQRRLVPENRVPFVVAWVERFLRLQVTRSREGWEDTLRMFLQDLEEGQTLDWQLRQSRVLVLGGRYQEGNQVLQNLIADYQQPEIEQTDRILQVLFDLQTVDLHQQAITHFNQLLKLEIEPKQRREVLYWIADSYRGLEKYDQAALLYLQSAMLTAPDAMDPWAQTARFNAAESLQLSGLTDDARRIYQELLAISDDVARRSVLNHKIQQLWLNQRAIDTDSN